MKKIEWIVVHCSDSDWGCARVIDQWHRARGWNGIGYHFVLGNGFPTEEDFKAGRRLPWAVCQMESGRPLDGDPWMEAGEVGSHVLGLNAASIGVCCIGRKPTERQLMSLAVLCRQLADWFGLPSDRVVGHRETPSGKAQGKTCPNFDVEAEIRVPLRTARGR